MIDPRHDLATVAGLRQIVDDGFVQATYALRLDFHCPAPLSPRPCPSVPPGSTRSCCARRR